MLTCAQIQRIAQRCGIGTQAQERDYMQHIALYSLYATSLEFAFKGGTAIRIVYRGSRYSEDLDFNYAGKEKDVLETWAAVLRRMDYFGCATEIRNSWKGEFSFSFDISYNGPLYDGRDRTKGKVRVDINLRNEKVETRQILVTSEYDDLRPHVLTVLTPEQLLAEKFRALLTRSKPRDVYDIWLLSRRGINLDIELLNRKLAIYGYKFSKERLDQALLSTKRTWEQDLRGLLPQYIEWNELTTELINYIVD
ncbi:MAG: nucleotidyl transferase AbiEii/AbiGii toxin family protein [Anaerolineales bacterium]|nr:nucleotidyl transferase AbiEii/AbiGii toxin family protein [Anaerolineales bacterium]